MLEVPRQPTALAFNTAGTLFAAADSEGSVTVWVIPEGKVLESFRITRVRVDALSFSRDAGLVPGPGDKPQLKGMLTGGGAGGSLAIWDLRDRLITAVCQGSRYNVFCTAFSPDGTLLASGGREQVHLWDVATGRLLLSLHGEDWVTGLAFSPDGEHLVTGGRSVWDRARAIIWRLENGRGIRTLPGLTQPVANIRSSADGRRIAALAQNWEVAVWELPQGRLRQTFRVPPGLTADNAALAFSRDGRKLAFSSGQAARLWDVESGDELKRWALPPGIQDQLAFDGEGRLLLFRVDEKGAVVRNLLGEKALEPVASIRGFRRRILASAFTPDGRFLAVDGQSGPEGKERQVRVFEAGTGKELWAKNVEWTESAVLAIDPEGKILAFQPRVNANQGGVLVEVASGKELDSLPRLPFGVSPRAKYIARLEESQVNHTWSLILYLRKDPSPLLTLGVDVPVSWGPVQFDGDGTRVMWGNVDGNVLVADLKEVQRRLAEFRLGWEE